MKLGNTWIICFIYILHTCFAKELSVIRHFIKKTDRVICYYGQSLSQNRQSKLLTVDDIDRNFCTHLIWHSIVLDANGVIRFTNLHRDNVTETINNFTNRRERDLVVLLSWSGWNENLEIYQRLINNPNTLHETVMRIKNFILNYEFDGLDIDLTYDNIKNVDLNLQITLMKKLNFEFQYNNLILTAAVSGKKKTIQTCYQIKEMIENVNFINMKGYDLSKPDNVCKLLAPLRQKSENGLYSVEDSLNMWLSLGVPRQKLVLGVPMIGEKYILENSQQYFPGSPVKGKAQVLPYNQICSLLHRETWNMKYTEIENVNWAHKQNDWITFPSVESTKAKAQLVSELNLGGIAAWGIGWDDFMNNCGHKWALLKAINDVLRPGTLNNEELKSIFKPSNMTTNILSVVHENLSTNTKQQKQSITGSNKQTQDKNTVQIKKIVQQHEPVVHQNVQSTVRIQIPRPQQWTLAQLKQWAKAQYPYWTQAQRIQWEVALQQNLTPSQLQQWASTHGQSWFRYQK